VQLSAGFEEGRVREVPGEPRAEGSKSAEGRDVVNGCEEGQPHVRGDVSADVAADPDSWRCVRAGCLWLLAWLLVLACECECDNARAELLLLARGSEVKATAVPGAGCRCAEGDALHRGAWASRPVRKR